MTGRKININPQGTDLMVKEPENCGLCPLLSLTPYSSEKLILGASFQKSLSELIFRRVCVHCKPARSSQRHHKTTREIFQVTGWLTGDQQAVDVITTHCARAKPTHTTISMPKY